jgi:hypothetical protein
MLHASRTLQANKRSDLCQLVTDEPATDDGGIEFSQFVSGCTTSLIEKLVGGLNVNWDAKPPICDECAALWVVAWVLTVLEEMGLDTVDCAVERHGYSPLDVRGFVGVVAQEILGESEVTDGPGRDVRQAWPSTAREQNKRIRREQVVRLIWEHDV